MRYIRNLTLQELCLQAIIIEHLHRFIYSEERFIPQKHIDFLFRLHAKECFIQYTNIYRKTERCLLWFLSPHNKKIFLPRITQNIMMKLQTVGPALTSLTLRETMATENVLNAVICCVPHLSYLDLSSTNCSDKTLSCIQRMCPDLITLNVQECDGITDDGMLNLCGSNLSLKNLNILYTSVEYGGLHDILKGMPSLQYLAYDNIADSFYYIHQQDVQHCIKKNIKYNLTELIYEDGGLSEDQLKVIWTWTVLCPKVEKVHILFPVTRDVLRQCSRFSHLKELKLVMENNYFDINIPDPLAPFLPVAENFSTLILSYVEIPSVTLIECFKNLKNLYLQKVTFTDFSEEEIKSKTTNLETLGIKEVHLVPTSTTYKFITLLISQSKNVTKLIVSRMIYLPDELVDTILNSMKSLIFVEFSFIRTPLPSFFSRFFEILSVQRVYLDGCIAPFSKLAPTTRQSSTLSWCIMNTIFDDDDDENDDFPESKVLSAI